MQILEDITDTNGTTNLVNITQVCKKANTGKRITKSNEQNDVDYTCRLHINFHLRLHHSNINQHITFNNWSVNITVKRPKTKTAYWSRIRKKAPKVPDITCPAIDSVLNKLEKQVNRALTMKQFKTIERKLEKLRIANEKLRESGIYWHDACKDTVRDLLGKKKMR